MQKVPRIAILSFPGNNGEVESMRVIRRVGMEAIYFRWNDDRAKLNDVDGYFIPGGFSYEDRGRSGMVAARDPLMEYIGAEAQAGKVVIGNIGSPGRMEYSVLGDTVNLAFRLEPHAPPNGIAASESAYQAIGDEFPRAEEAQEDVRGFGILKFWKLVV